MSNIARVRRWTGWSSRRPSLLHPFPVLRFEELEARHAPATFTWTGLGADQNWSTGANWQGNVAPSGKAAPGDDLVFPGSAAKKAPVNDLTNGVFNSLTFSGGGYTVTGNPITLPAAVGTGVLVVGAGAKNDILALDTTFGAAFGVDQTITVLSTGELTLSGKLSSTAGSNITKDGAGTLTLSGNNSGFTGVIKVNNTSGILVVANKNALGTTTAPTTIGTGSTLEVASGVGTINEPLTLNGLGVINEGALINLAGTNKWAGDITLDSNAAIGASAGVLNITGAIDDNGSGWNLVKEGFGEVQLNSPTGNTYRGKTIVNNGILTAGSATALGDPAKGGAGTPANGTYVNETLTKAGQLRLADPAGKGFTIVDEYLELNGDAVIPGVTPANPNIGALTNTRGDNNWAGSVVLGSPSPVAVTSATVGAAPNTNLTISGVVSSPNQPTFTLIKQDQGRVILNNRNTYTGATDVQQGFLNARDSLALGGNALTVPAGKGTTVQDGATLELEVEFAIPSNPQTDAHGRDLGDDSITRDPNRLTISESLTLYGRGVGAKDQAGGVGALRSVSGINIYAANITLAGVGSQIDLAAAIGVEPDQRPGHPTPDSTYFINDYSLTVTGTIGGTKYHDFIKRGGGNLILPVANTYTGITRIEQGWVTIQNQKSLGERIAGLGDTLQPGTFVSDGAALHLKPLTGSLTFPENLTISGTGPVHPYAFISQKGAVVNLAGQNTISGDIGLLGPGPQDTGTSGVGVEQVDPASPSELTVTGSVTDGRRFAWYGSGNTSSEQAFRFDAGATNGVLQLTYDMQTFRDQLRVYYAPRAPGTLIYDTGYVTGSKIVNLPFGPGTGTIVELVMNEGGNPFVPFIDPWVLYAAYQTTGGGLVKFGSQRLSLQGDGTYSGATEVREGTLLAQNDTALGLASSGTAVNQETFRQTNTSVRSGAVLELSKGTATRNGGISAGVEVWNERLTLNSPGQQLGVAGDQTPAPTTFNLTFKGQTTVDLPLAVPASGGALVSDSVENALNALSTIKGSEVQQLDVSGTSGTFTLSFNGRRTGPLAFNAAAGTIETALNLLTTIGGVGGAVTVTGGPGTFLITFGGTLAFTNVPEIIPAGISGTTATVTTVRDGINASVTVTQVLGVTGETQYSVTFNGDLANTNVPPITAAGTGGDDPTVTTTQDGGPGVSEIQAIHVIASIASFSVKYPGGATSVQIPITATAAEVAFALNGIVPPALGPVTAVRSGSIFTLTFGNALTADVPLLQLGTTIADAEVSFSGATDIGGGNYTSASLVSLSDDNIWRGPATLNASDRVWAAANSRVSILGAVDDSANSRSVVTTVRNGAPGLPEIQTVQVALKNGAFGLSFNGQTTALLPFNATASQVQAALNALSTIGGVGGSVTLAAANVAGDTRYTITFGGTLGNSDQPPITGPTGADLVKRGTGEFLLGGGNSYGGTTLIDEGVVTAMTGSAFGSTAGGTVVSNGAQLQFQGNLTIAGESLTLQGSGPGSLPTNLPTRWFNLGAAPINNAQTPNNLPATGRLTGVAIDPTDSNVIYISAAGGGAWKTKDAGRTWVQLFDANAQLPGGGVDPNAVMWGGAIAVAPTDPRVIYFATGEESGSGDSYAGSGVYKSTDSGRSWTLLTNPGGGNPLFGQAVSRIAVSPLDANTIFLSSSDLAQNGVPAGAPGIWRYSATSWFNMTASVSFNRNNTFGQSPFDAPSPPASGGIGPPRNAGPDDDYRIKFPQSNAAWTDLQIIRNTLVFPNTITLYAALGRGEDIPTEQNFAFTLNPPNVSSYAVRDAVYRTMDLTSNTPAWFIGSGGADTRPSNAYPVNNVQTAISPRNYNIKLSGVPTVSGNTVYAVNVIEGTGTVLDGTLQDIQKTVNSGATWAATAGAPSPYYMGGSPITTGQGWYDSTIIAVDANTVVVGGAGVSATNPSGSAYRTVNGGTAWTDISTDSKGFGPHADYHASIVDKTGAVYVGTDGGVWRLDPTSLAWTNLNGNLGVTQFNGIDVNPLDPTIALGGSQDNGTELFNNSPAWSQVDDGDGGVVHINQQNPNFAFHVLNGGLRKSTDGGLTWADVTTITQPTLGLYFPFIIDPVNPQRLLVGGDFTPLQESADNGATWVNLNAPFGGVAVASASYQGAFQSDPGFPLVADRLSNTYDPDTIYVSDGLQIAVTKNHGVLWLTRNIPGVNSGITDIAVDPSNRDTVYVTVSRAPGAAGARIYRSTDAGQTWTAIGGNLPTIPTWKVVVDPRSGTIYLGNDNGVWSLPNARTTGTFTWTRFGSGMPRVQVKDLVLNQQLNMLSAGTYGRSMFQLFLTNYPTLPELPGALRAVSGSSVWTGPVTLAGETWLSAAGTQQIQNGIAVASLNIIGPIGDGPGGPFKIHKIDLGTITFSGSNTYAGQTLVEEGVLQVNNIDALGLPSANTVVTAGAALELRNDLQLEPITINGNGIAFNNHNTGALRNVSNNNTYTGPLTFATNTTIGVDSGTTLTIGQKPGVLLGTGSITDGAAAFGFDKELPGKLILAPDGTLAPNTYDGLTKVIQGAIQVQDASALGSPGAGTEVLDGAQVQIARNALTLTATVIAAEPLSLSGTGVGGTGALAGVRVDADPSGATNSWQGPITFTIDPGTFPPTTPGTQIAIGVSDVRDTLIADTVIDQDGTKASFGLIKVGPGRLTLTRSNLFTGVTNINAGTVRVSNTTALGPIDPTTGTGVSSEVQTINVVGTTGTYQLSFNGVTSANINATDSAGTVRTRLGALSTIGGVGNVTVSETPSLTGKVFTVTFQGALANLDLPAIVAVVAPGPLQPTVSVATTQQGGLGTVVATGASLELDGTAGALAGAERLTLNGNGVGNAGALNDVAGDNTYSGPVTLATSASLGAVAGTTLTVTGLVQDPATITVPAPQLRKAGPGTVVFPSAEQYAGKTVVAEGVLRILNPQALGQNRSEQQMIGVYGNSGTLTLTYNGQSATINLPLTPANLRTAIQTALTGLLPAGGSVTVTTVAPAPPGGNQFLVTFGGTVANMNVTPITANLPVGVPAVNLATATTVQDGFGPEVQTVTVTATNGTFRLTFRGQATGFLRYNVPASGGVGPTASLQNALNALSTIGGVGGSVGVTSATILGGTVYTIVFGGSLANSNLPQLTATVTGGTTATPATANDGPEGTSVTGGATLQVGDSTGLGITMQTEVVTINGQGFNNQGALNDYSDLTTPASGIDNWAAVPLVLGSNAAIGTTRATDRLTFTTPITDNASKFNLDIYGPGTVVFQNNGNNLYTGTTTVHPAAAAGTLQLSQPSGLAILGPLVVGVGGETGTALVQETLDAQIADTAAVTVNLGGTFDLNTRTDTIGKLSVVGGAVQTGAAGKLTTANVDMTGGTIAVGAGGRLNSANVTMAGGTIAVGAGGTATTQNIGMTGGTIALTAAASSLVLNGNITTLPAAASAFITGPGAIDLNGADRTVTVADGTPAQDLVVSAQLTSAGGDRFIKTGAGRLEFRDTTLFGVTIDVQAGDLQVGEVGAPTAIGPVLLDGGSLSGNGTVNGIAQPARSPASTVAPGVPGVASPSTFGQNPTSILRSSADVTWGAQTTFAVDLSNTTSPGAIPHTPTPGLDFDQLVVNGKIDLGGATLTATFGSGILLADRFPILTATGGFTNRFAEPYGANVVFAQGQKFAVDYTSDPNTIFLEKILAAATVQVVSSANPSTRGQPLTFTATVKPERGAGAIPGADTVTFEMVRTSPAFPPITIRSTESVNGFGVYVFDPAAVLGSGVPAGDYTVTARFDGDPLSFGTATDTIGQTIELPAIAPLSTVPANAPLVISPGNSPTIQDSIEIATSVTQERSPTTWTVEVRNSLNNVIRSYSTAGVISGNSFPIDWVWNGRDNLAALVSDGVYTIEVSFLDVYGNSGVTAPLTVVVDNTSPTISTPPGLVTSSLVIAPGTAATVMSDTTISGGLIDNTALSWTLTIAKAGGKPRVFTGTGANVAQVWDGRDGNGAIVDGVYTATLVATDAGGNTGAPVTTSIVVLTQAPTLTVTSVSTTYGQSMSFTATMTLPSFLPTSVATLMAGRPIQFQLSGGPVFGTANLGPVTLSGGVYRATATLSNVASFDGSPHSNVGTYSVTTTFAGSPEFLPAASSPRNHTISAATLRATADAKSMVYGATPATFPALTYTLSGLASGDSPGIVTGSPATTATPYNPPLTQSSNVGVYPITQGSVALVPGNNNYILLFTGNSLTVTPAPLSVAANAQTKVYGDPLPSLTVTVNGLVTGDTQSSVLSGSLQTNATPASHVGSYTITRGSLTANSNYTMTFTDSSLNVTPAPLGVVADPKTRVYGAPIPALTYQVGALVNGDQAKNVVTGSLATDALPGSPVGIYQITRGTLTASDDYTMTFTDATLTEVAAPLTVTASSATTVYGAAVPTLTYSVSGLVNGDSPGIVTGSPDTAATSSSHVGVYPITQGTITLSSINYTLVFNGSNLTVTKASLAISADGATKLYGAPVPLPLTYTIDPVRGLVNGDTAGSVISGGLKTTATQASIVGSYPITQDTLAATDDYNLIFTGSNLAVGKAPLAIDVNDATRVFGTPNPAFTASYNGLVLNDTPAVVAGVNLTTTATTSSPADTYSIFSSTTPVAQNYAVTLNPGRLSVTPTSPPPPVSPPPVSPPPTSPPPASPPTSPPPGTSPPVSPPALTTQPLTDVAVGSGAGVPATVNLYTPAGQFKTSRSVFGPTYNGGTRTANADFNGDGVQDLAVGSGPGAPDLLQVFDGKTGQELFSISPFGGFTGGLFVAAGDITGDGRADLVVTPDQGGGPRVEIFRGGDFAKIDDFFGINDINFRGGARAAVGDIDGDGHADLVVSAGFGGGPRISVWDGAALTDGQQTNMMPDFFLFEQGLRNGAYVAVGDVDGDGRADIIGGAGPGGGPRIRIISGKDALAIGPENAQTLADFFGGNLANRAGIRVAAKNLDGDKFADLTVGDGEGAGARVTAYKGSSLAIGGSDQLYSYDAFANLGGVYVG